MTDRFDLVPRPQLPQRDNGPGVRLDPKVRAQMRRDAGDRDQLSWDESRDPALMLQALLAEQPDPSVILPAAKFIDTMNKLFGECGRRVDPMIWTRTLQTCAKQILRGQFYTATMFLRHACTGAGLAKNPDEAYGMFARVILEFFPSAPGTWLTPAITTERDRLLGDNASASQLPCGG